MKQEVPFKRLEEFGFEKDKTQIYPPLLRRESIIVCNGKRNPNMWSGKDINQVGQFGVERKSIRFYGENGVKEHIRDLIDADIVELKELHN